MRAFWSTIGWMLILVACGQAPKTQPRPGATPVRVASPTAEARAAAARGGRVYFVSPNGNDAATGTRTDPWQHPAVAVRRLRPGDTLVFLPGTYLLRDYERDVIRPPSGRPGAWITLRGEPDAAYPVLAGQENLLTAFDLAGVAYVRLEHLEITHNPRARDVRFREGITAVGAPARHLVFRDLYIHHVDEFGIDIQDVEDLRIEGSRILYAGFGAIGGPRGAHGGWRDVYIQDSVLAYSGHYYQGGDGASRPYDRPDGLGIEPSPGPLVLDRVVVMHNYGDGIDSKAEHTVIRESVVANNTCDGVKLWGREGRLENVLIYGRGDGDPTPTPWGALVIDTRFPHATFTLLHVTIDDALGQNYPFYVQYDHPEVPVTVRMRNSIVASRGPRAAIFTARNVTLDLATTLLYFPQSPEAWTNGQQSLSCTELTAWGPGIQCGDSRFRHPAWGTEGDYHLQASSPAIDAGQPMGLTHDLEGHPRDARPDLGAYEYRP